MFIFPPSRPSVLLRAKLWLIGRGDSKRYRGTLDSTPTHATLYVQSLVQAGQHRVNAQYLEEARKLAQSIAVTRTSIEFHQNALLDLKSLSSGLKGRLRDKNLAGQSVESKKLDDLRNQLASNEKQLELLAFEGQSALNSWTSHFYLLASIYMRRRMKAKGNSATMDADLPVYDAIPLAEIDEKKSRIESKS